MTWVCTKRIVLGFCTGSVLLYTDVSTQYRNDKESLQCAMPLENGSSPLQAIADTTSDLIEHYLNSPAQAGSGFDVVGNFAEPILVRVIGQHLLGMTPEACLSDLRSLTRSLRTLGTSLIDAETTASTRKAGEHVAALIRAREGMAGDDLAAQLYTPPCSHVASVEGSVAGLSLAAMATVARGLGQVADQLMKRPDVLQLADDCGDDDSMLDQVIRECLRFNPVLVFIRRYAVRDVTLDLASRTSRIPAGSHVLVGLSPAMFDPEAFPLPNEFRLDRPKDSYLHFGAGTHQCFGQPIAEQLLRQMTRALVKSQRLVGACTGSVEFDSWALTSLVVERQSAGRRVGG